MALNPADTRGSCECAAPPTVYFCVWAIEVCLLHRLRRPEHLWCLHEVVNGALEIDEEVWETRSDVHKQTFSGLPTWPPRAYDSCHSLTCWCCHGLFRRHLLPWQGRNFLFYFLENVTCTNFKRTWSYSGVRFINTLQERKYWYINTDLVFRDFPQKSERWDFRGKFIWVLLSS